MSLKLLALILTLIGMTVALLNPSDAYRVGYAEGRFDLYTESKAIKKLHQCVADKKNEWDAQKKEASEAEKTKAAEDCWKHQIDWTKVVYQSWDRMTDQEKVDLVAPSTQSTGGIKWAEILRGKADSKVMPPLPVVVQ